LEIRVDLTKYAFFSKRGKCSRKNGIGVWKDVIKMIGTVAIAINLALILQEWYHMDVAIKQYNALNNTD